MIDNHLNGEFLRGTYTNKAATAANEMNELLVNVAIVNSDAELSAPIQVDLLVFSLNVMNFLIPTKMNPKIISWDTTNATAFLVAIFV